MRQSKPCNRGVQNICCERVDRIPTLGIQAAVRLSLQRAWPRKLPFSPVLVGALLPLILIAPAAPAQHAGVGAPTPAQQAAGASNGSEIFAQRCSQCHGDRGQGIASAVTIAGPSLQAEHDAGKVMTAVEWGPSHMPAFSRVLSVPQIHSVSGYVTTQLAIIPLTQGDLGEGGKLFRVYCASCHRTAVRGGALAFTGRNAPALTNKSAALIAGAVRWGPGTMPAFPEPVLSDQQLSSVVRYVKFVQHPPDPGGDPLKYYGPVSEGLAAGAVLMILIGFTGWIEKGEKG